MKLFDEFQPVSAKQWEEKINKDLKITSIDELMWHTPEGIAIRPFYTAEHLKNLDVKPFPSPKNWEIVQYIPAFQHTSEEINEYIIKSLNGGVSGICLEFYKKYDFSKCFNNVSLPHLYSNFQISFDALDILYNLKDTYFSINEYTQSKNCFINIDPIYLFEKFGEWHLSQIKDFEILFELNHIPVNSVLYKESGANVVQELAYTLAHLNEYLYFLEEKNKLSNYKNIHIHISVGNSFFTEIARIRALRILVQHLLKEYKHNAQIHIHAQTTLLNKSYLDIYNNLIRTTTETMSAIFGGANSISSLPFDFPFNEISDFSLRMARNQLLIMKEESYLNKTTDVVRGNFYIENYTYQLIDKAYSKFLEIEKQNGLIALLEKNSVQDEIQQSFETQLKKYIEQKEILIGINKYPNPNAKTKTQLFYTLNPSSTSSVKPLYFKRYTEYFELQTQAV